MRGFNLQIATETVCQIIAMARRYQAKDAPMAADPASNASDDHMVAVLEDRRSDPLPGTFTGFVDGLSENEQVELVALAWLGRDGGSATEFGDRRDEAAAAHAEQTGAYLLEIPLLAEYLTDALAAFDLRCDDQA